MPVNLGSTAVAAGSAYVGSDAVAVYVGSDLVLARAASPSFNSQTFTLPNGLYSDNTSFEFISWAFSTPYSEQVDAALIPSGVNRYLAFLRIDYSTGSAGAIRLNFAATDTTNVNNADLSDAFESSGKIILTSGSDTVTIEMAGNDATEPYEFTPSNSADVATFANAVRAKSDRTITMELRDG